MFYEAVMLFGRSLSQRLEPVGVMTCAIVDGPLLHTLGDTVSHFA